MTIDFGGTSSEVHQGLVSHDKNLPDEGRKVFKARGHEWFKLNTPPPLKPAYSYFKDRFVNGDLTRDDDMHNHCHVWIVGLLSDWFSLYKSWLLQGKGSSPEWSIVRDMVLLYWDVNQKTSKYSGNKGFPELGAHWHK